MYMTNSIDDDNCVHTVSKWLATFFGGKPHIIIQHITCKGTL